jgi:amino acid transporter
VLAGLLVPSGERFSTLFVAATAQAILLVLIYTALALGAVRLLIKSNQPQPLWRWVVFPLAAVVPLLALYGTLVPFPDFPERWGLFAGSAALVIVAVWLLRMRSKPAALPIS